MAIAAVFGAGLLLGQLGHHHASAGHGGATHVEPAAEGHAGHGPPETHGDANGHDDLRPLMRGMLVDLVALRGADEASATEHSKSIADACDSGEEEAPSEVPEAWGKDFAPIDRALHRDAAETHAALVRGDIDGARAAYLRLVSDCTSCHEQSSAAQHVDLQTLSDLPPLAAR